MARRRYRKKDIRPPRNTIIIVCEGERTETQYFDNFNEPLTNLQIKTFHEYTDPRHMVDYSIARISKWGVDLDGGDAIWCVFDVDSNRSEDIRNATEHANANGINIGLSNPCLELWFILHFVFYNNQLTHREAPSVLREYVPNYRKNYQIYNEIINFLDDAIIRAKRLNVIHLSQSYELYSRDSNPSSQVFKLIEYIQEIKKRNRANIP
jgi:hypothetical protein